MLLQTNSYIVPRDKRMEHDRLLRRFRQTLMRLGCDHFEVYEQVGANWSSSESTGRFVQIMRFRDRRHQMAVQSAERSDPGAQAVVREFCELINFPYQQQQGLFAVGFYTSFLRTGPTHGSNTAAPAAQDEIPQSAPPPAPAPVSRSFNAASQPAVHDDLAQTLQTDQPQHEAQTEILGDLAPESGNGEYHPDMPTSDVPDNALEPEPTQSIQPDQPDQLDASAHLEHDN